MSISNDLKKGGVLFNHFFKKKSNNKVTFFQSKISEIFLGSPLPPPENIFSRLVLWLYIRNFHEIFPQGFALGHLKIDSKKSYHQAYKGVTKLNFKKLKFEKKVLKKGGYYLITLSIVPTRRAISSHDPEAKWYYLN